MFYNGCRMKEVFLKAKKNKFGIIASNVVFDFAVRPIIQGYMKHNSDGLLQMSSGAVKYAAGESQDIYTGAHLISNTVKTFASQFKNAGVGLHIDHATPNYMDFVIYCIENGLVSSVMIDASHEKFEENVRISKEIVTVAHRYGVIVEGEIGYIKGTEDEIVSDTELYTSPEEALEYVSKTNVDLFAASVGTNHGVSKGSKIKLNLDLIKEIDNLLIANKLERGIVLHGASGLTDYQQQTAIANGVVKINKDTCYQMDAAEAVAKFWGENADAIIPPKGVDPEEFMPDKKRFDPRKWIIFGEKAQQKTVEDLVTMSGSANQSILL